MWATPPPSSSLPVYEPSTSSSSLDQGSSATAAADLASTTLKTKLQVKVSCTNLLNRDVLSKSDPQVYIFIQHVTESSRVRLRRSNSISSTLSSDSLVEMRLTNPNDSGFGGGGGSEIVGGWKLHSKSSTINDTLNPVFPDLFSFDYYFEEVVSKFDSFLLDQPSKSV